LDQLIAMPDENPVPGNPVDDVEVPIQFGLGHLSLPLREFKTIQPGFVFQLDGDAGNPVLIEVNGTLIGRGELVLVDGRPGVRFTERCHHGNEHS
jgi:flagellar motor switch/type III secretory pathway protein FliN